MRTTNQARKVLLVELNEITWRFIDPLCDRGKLPTFDQFRRYGTRGSPMATEVPPNLDPWIAWTTVYTGRPQEEHGVRFLEQPPDSVRGPRVWEIAADAGRSVGVYGSIMSWPPRAVRGFWVPSTFSPTPATFPANLEPIQDLNLSQTRAHTPVGPGAKPIGSLGRLRAAPVGVEVLDRGAHRVLSGPFADQQASPLGKGELAALGESRFLRAPLSRTST